MAEHKRNGTEPPPAVSPSIVPESYPTLLPGEERPLQSKLNWWDSFQTAAGPIASTFRFTVALAIVAGAVWFTFPKPWIEWIESEPWRDLLPQLMEFPR